MNALSKRDKENIAELNAMLGTKYKETEFDLENTKDLIKIIENITAEYMDYTNYYGELEDILENFDQSLEVFHPEKYYQILKGKIEKSCIMETYFSIKNAADNMQDLVREAEEKCKKIWKYMLLGDNKEAQKYFIEDISKHKKEELLQALEETIENIYDVDYNNEVQKDTKNFAKSIKEYLNKEAEEYNF